MVDPRDRLQGGRGSPSSRMFDFGYSSSEDNTYREIGRDGPPRRYGGSSHRDGYSASGRRPLERPFEEDLDLGYLSTRRPEPHSALEHRSEGLGLEYPNSMSGRLRQSNRRVNQDRSDPLGGSNRLSREDMDERIANLLASDESDPDFERFASHSLGLSDDEPEMPDFGRMFGGLGAHPRADTDSHRHRRGPGSDGYRYLDSRSGPRMQRGSDSRDDDADDYPRYATGGGPGRLEPREWGQDLGLEDPVGYRSAARYGSYERERR